MTSYADPSVVAGTWTQENLRRLLDKIRETVPDYNPPGFEPPKFDPNTNPSYVAGSGAIDTNLQNLYAQLGFNPTNQQFGGGAYDKGAQNFGVDASGNRISDPNSPLFNPYSRAALLEQSWKQTKTGNTNSMAARGQLYSGALQNAQNDADRGYSISNDSLVRGARDYYENLRNQAVNATGSANLDKIDLAGSALDTFVSQQAAAPPPTYSVNDPRPRPSYLPEGYETWSQQRKSRYWFNKRKNR